MRVTGAFKTARKRAAEDEVFLLNECVGKPKSGAAIGVFAVATDGVARVLC
jgi:hypothetical protein